MYYSDGYLYAQVYFGTHHARWYLFFNTLGVPCVNGMSSIFNKKQLEKYGESNKNDRYVKSSYAQ